MTDKYIPSITIKCSKHPPWYDKETFVLAKKKGRLRKKYKDNKTQENYNNYANCRKNLKVLVKTKMRANFEEDEDLALVSKKFWGHLKSTSGSSSIPETVNYGSRFRNKPQDQAELFINFLPINLLMSLNMILTLTSVMMLITTSILILGKFVKC